MSSKKTGNSFEDTGTALKILVGNNRGSGLVQRVADVGTGGVGYNSNLN